MPNCVGVPVACQGRSAVAEAAPLPAMGGACQRWLRVEDLVPTHVVGQAD